MRRWYARPNDSGNHTIQETVANPITSKNLKMSLNKVMLIGNVGKEPDVRYIDNGVATATLRLATSTPGYTLPNGTTVPERTEWHSILLWRRLAEIVERYVHTGDKLYIEGQLRTRTYTDKQGKTRYVTEIWAENMEMLSPRANGSTSPQSVPQPQNSVKKQAPEDCPF
ncbi:single-strand binding family protein [Prevotella sp. MGM2]|nr:single-strand binding family protein [Prevotella sp. MGM2]